MGNPNNGWKINKSTEDYWRPDLQKKEPLSEGVSDLVKRRYGHPFWLYPKQL